MVLEGAVLVLSGSFNPAIFHPGWLVSVGLASQQEGELAKVKHADSVLSRFEIRGVGVDVRPDQLTVASIEATIPETIVDLAVGMLRLLPHSVANAVGMSRTVHAGTPETFAALEAHLDAARVLAETFEVEGLKRLEVQGRLPDEDHTFTLAVEPSEFADYGVYVVATKSLSRPEGAEDGATWAADAIDAAWFTWMADAQGLIGSVLGLTDETAGA
jgi:hypothetical protein